jgi:hypothetical protein
MLSRIAAASATWMLLCSFALCQTATNPELDLKKTQILEQLKEIDQTLKGTVDQVNRDYLQRNRLPPSQREQVEVLKELADRLNAEICLRRDLLAFVTQETTASDTPERAQFQEALALVEKKMERASIAEKERLIIEFRNLNLRLSDGIAKILSGKACGSQTNSFYLVLDPSKITDIKTSALVQADNLRQRIFDPEIGLLYATCNYIRLRIPNYRCQ